MGVPFECDLCHFRNITGRDPVWDDTKDVDTLVAIRRANLDALWAREPGTVGGNLSRARRDYLDATTLYSIKDPLPYLPTHTVEDKLGMKPALITLATTLRAGVYTRNIQFATARKTCTWYGNVHNAGAGYDGRLIEGTGGAGEEEAEFESSSPTRGEWFSRFTRGLKLRM
ncbi:hypothetical protein ACHAXR_000074, partial [Thalassiosira sp. AJA248-18]